MLAKKSQCSACSWMLVKTIRHPFCWQQSFWLPGNSADQCGYRSCSNCCWAWIASLLAVTWTCKFFFCCFIFSINSSALARRPFWSKLVWNSLSNCTTGICGLSLYCKPYGHVEFFACSLRTCNDLLHYFGSPGFQRKQSIADGFGALCLICFWFLMEAGALWA